MVSLTMSEILTLLVFFAVGGAVGGVLMLMLLPVFLCRDGVRRIKEVNTDKLLETKPPATTWSYRGGEGDENQGRDVK